MAGKFSSGCDTQDSRAEEDKTKKRWIKNVQDQEEVDQDFTRSAGIDESRVQDQEVDRLIKISRNKAQGAMSIPISRLGTPEVSSSHYGS